MRKGTVWIILGLLCIAGALGLTGYNIWDSRRAERESQEALEKLLPLIDPDPIPAEGRPVGSKAEKGQTPEISPEDIEYPDYILNPEMDMPTEKIDGYNYIGTLWIPALERTLPVMEDWDYVRLKKAPCRYVGSAYLDNMVLCAHNNRHFGEIKNLRMGDSVTFTDIDGNVFIYKVIEIEILNPMEVERMTSGDWDLTLFTCTIGGRTRVTVRCERIK